MTDSLSGPSVQQAARQMLIELGRFNLAATTHDELIASAYRVPPTEKTQLARFILGQNPDSVTLRKMWQERLWDNQEALFQQLCAQTDIDALFELWPLMGDPKVSEWPRRLAQEIIQHEQCNLERVLQLYRLVPNPLRNVMGAGGSYYELAEFVDTTVKDWLQAQSTEYLLSLLNDRAQLQPIAIVIGILAMRHNDLRKLLLDEANGAHARQALALTQGIDLAELPTPELLQICRPEAPGTSHREVAKCLAEREDCTLWQFLSLPGLFFSLLVKKCEQTPSEDILAVLDELASASDVHQHGLHNLLVQAAARVIMGRELLSSDQAIHLVHHYLDVAKFGEDTVKPAKEWLQSKLRHLPWESLFAYARGRFTKVGEIVVDVMRTRASELSTEDLLKLCGLGDYRLDRIATPCLQSRIHDLQRLAAA